MKRGRNSKRGQLYLISAIMISAVIVGLVTVNNNAKGAEEPDNFYDITKQIKDEAAVVISSDVVSGSDNMEDFADASAKSLRASDPDIEVVFLYGDENLVNVLNYAETDITAGNEVLSGANAPVNSKIVVDVGGTNFSSESGGINKQLFNTSWEEEVMPPNSNEITIKLNGKDYNFNLYKDQQFFMIIKKTKEGNNYVDFG